ncbi:hypothetical protein acsn021_11780 [Anaerocolumna cellulosilytica]|uniref:Uncharacterized protein n=1 Tax=Anaerocolumna cellulosilytica TaxID=433286 RepID=A0A6S6QX36_9FIRM|nr:hypothetical protein [Anaerocolumna cellulosilytica]MBB5196086.1 hypothetical protein [Anaerocolumna cellulosilytica]BCJ93609.1 hypothetical protein acsn021_11780 [Anaerocolumna cellulosilytica]
MKNNRNNTIYWIVILGALLTVPAALIVMNKFTDASNTFKAVFITIIFFIISGAIALLYNRIFGVTMHEITERINLTELDKSLSWLQGYPRRQSSNSNSMKRLYQNVHRVCGQIDNFKRRKEVYVKLLDEAQLDRGNSLSQLVHTIENALVIHVERIINRIEIFDDKVQPSIVSENLAYIEAYVEKNETILLNFEKLIAQVSSMGDVAEEADISKLTDIIKAMESIRADRDDEIDDLVKKYQ